MAITLYKLQKATLQKELLNYGQILLKCMVRIELKFVFQSQNRISGENYIFNRKLNYWIGTQIKVDITPCVFTKYALDLAILVGKCAIII